MVQNKKFTNCNVHKNWKNALVRKPKYFMPMILNDYIVCICLYLQGSNTSSGSSFSKDSGELPQDLSHYDNPLSHYDNPKSLTMDKSAIRSVGRVTRVVNGNLGFYLLLYVIAFRTHVDFTLCIGKSSIHLDKKCKTMCRNMKPYVYDFNVYLDIINS